LAAHWANTNNFRNDKAPELFRFEGIHLNARTPATPSLQTGKPEHRDTIVAIPEKKDWKNGNDDVVGNAASARGLGAVWDIDAKVSNGKYRAEHNASFAKRLRRPLEAVHQCQHQHHLAAKLAYRLDRLERRLT